MNAPTTHLSTNTGREAQFLAPETHRGAGGARRPTRLEAAEFAVRLQAGALRLTWVGNENAYGVDARGAEFYAKDVAPSVTADATDRARREFIVEASTRNPSNRQRDELVDRHTTPCRGEASKKAAHFLYCGYWVEVFDGQSKELLAGPFDPDQRVPSFIV